MIDAHQHFWRPDRGDYGWMEGADPIIRRDYLPDDLAPVLRRFGVSGTVLVQAAPTLAETEFMLGLADEHAFILGVVGWLDFEAENFPADLARLKMRPKLAGLRPMLQDLDDDQWILRPAVLDALARLADDGIAFDILALPRHLPFVAEALERTPGLRAVVDHLAKPPVASGVMEPWKTNISRLAAMPNVYCKLSGLISEASHDAWSVSDLVSYVDHAAAAFGADRLMWGSDWPVCRLAGEYGDVLTAAMLSLPPAMRADPGIFGANAQRFYRLHMPR